MKLYSSIFNLLAKAWAFSSGIPSWYLSKPRHYIWFRIIWRHRINYHTIHTQIRDRWCILTRSMFVTIWKVNLSPRLQRTCEPFEPSQIENLTFKYSVLRTQSFINSFVPALTPLPPKNPAPPPVVACWLLIHHSKQVSLSLRWPVCLILDANCMLLMISPWGMFITQNPLGLCPLGTENDAILYVRLLVRQWVGLINSTEYGVVSTP